MQTAAQESKLPAAAIFVIFVTTLAGRFSLDRVAGHPLHLPDTRVLGACAVAVVVFFWRIRQRPFDYRHPWPVAAFWAYAVLTCLALAAFRAPPGARIGNSLINLVALAVLLAATIVVTARDPRRAALLFLRLLLATAVVYALAGLAAGPGVQGRYSAFGGGPIVFGRVVCMGIIAAVTLTVMSRRKALVLPIPLLAAAAFLSGSRGSVGALLAAGTLFLPVIMRRAKIRTVVCATVAGAAATVGVWQYILSHADTVGNRFTQGLSDGGYSSRPALLQIAWDTYKRNPIFGAGMDVFYVDQGRYLGLDYVHNVVGAIGSETGIVGLGCFAAAVFTWLRGARPWKQMPIEQLGCAVVAVFIFVESLVSGDYYDTRWMWILAVLVVNPAIRPVEQMHAAQAEIRRVALPARS